MSKWFWNWQNLQFWLAHIKSMTILRSDLLVSASSNSSQETRSYWFSHPTKCQHRSYTYYQCFMKTQVNIYIILDFNDMSMSNTILQCKFHVYFLIDLRHVQQSSAHIVKQILVSIPSAEQASIYLACCMKWVWKQRHVQWVLASTP